MTTVPSLRSTSVAAPAPKTVREMLESQSFLREIAKALPSTLTAQRFVRLALTGIHRVPDLAKCTLSSTAQCLLDCAQLGLEPGGPLGRAYLIPFRDRKNNQTICTLVIGYKGLVELAYRSGKLLSIRAEVVREGDHFVCDYGLDPRLEHRPNWDQPDSPISHAYAVAKLQGGATVWAVMHRSEIEAVRRRSRASDSGPWGTDYAEMAKKTVVRRLCKQLPMATEADLGLDAEDRSHNEAGAYVDITTLTQDDQKQIEERTPGDPKRAVHVKELAESLSLTGAKWEVRVRAAAQSAGLPISDIPSVDDMSEELLVALEKVLEEESH